MRTSPYQSTVKPVRTRDCLKCGAYPCVQANTGNCVNGLLDGVETDIDCGGPNDCPRCSNQMKCNVNQDCLFSYCDPTYKQCRVG